MAKNLTNLLHILPHRGYTCAFALGALAKSIEPPIGPSTLRATKDTARLHPIPVFVKPDMMIKAGWAKNIDRNDISCLDFLFSLAREYSA